ncbi:MAG: hypothetical protein JST54_26155 [Deltaproteobacteria bacterium]|nr:hypothetical protein [Deltaproteobacteria bacterium]
MDEFDSSGAPTGNSETHRFQITVPAHFSDDAGNCINMYQLKWGLDIVDNNDGGLSPSGFEGGDGEIDDAGAWRKAEQGGEHDLNYGFYDCNFGNQVGAEAMFGEVDALTYIAHGGQVQYNSESDFAPLFFLVPR